MEGNLSQVPPDWLNFIPVSPRVFVLAARRLRLHSCVCLGLILLPARWGKARDGRRGEGMKEPHKAGLLNAIMTTGGLR